MSFGLYSIGFAIVIGGLIYAAYLLHMPAHWIAVGATVLLGVGILTGVRRRVRRIPWRNGIAGCDSVDRIVFEFHDRHNRLRREGCFRVLLTVRQKMKALRAGR